jgi:hypothetical protein
MSDNSLAELEVGDNPSPPIARLYTMLIHEFLHCVGMQREDDPEPDALYHDAIDRA